MLSKREHLAMLGDAFKQDFLYPEVDAPYVGG